MHSGISPAGTGGRRVGLASEIDLQLLYHTGILMLGTIKSLLRAKL